MNDNDTQYYIAASSSPHLAQRPLLLGVLRPVAKLPPSLAVTTPTCCWQPETWTWLFWRFHNFFIKCFSWYLVFRWDWHKWLLKMTLKACQNQFCQTTAKQASKSGIKVNVSALVLTRFMSPVWVSLKFMSGSQYLRISDNIFVALLTNYGKKIYRPALI